MTGRELIDSNILIYAFDPASRDKRARAACLLDGLEPIGRGMLSTQVLGAFFDRGRFAHPPLASRFIVSAVSIDCVRYATSTGFVT